MSRNSCIFVIDDDDDVRDSLRALLESAGMEVEDYHSARIFLDRFSPQKGACIIADIRMPDMDGLALQEELGKRQINIPVIIVTGHGDVPLAVRAMKAGAVDFLEKPYDDRVLLETLHRAITAKPPEEDNPEAAAASALIRTLSQREHEVLQHLIAGSPNKIVAYELGISPRTVEIHRARLMAKMQIRSLAELVRLALLAGVTPAGSPH